MNRLVATIVFLGVGRACGSRYTYVPAANATATMQGRVAADYEIPPSDPTGDARIASYGIIEVRPKDKPAQALRALHIRVLLANRGATQWTFDTRDQRIALDGFGAIAPAFASANPGSNRPSLGFGTVSR